MTDFLTNPLPIWVWFVFATALPIAFHCCMRWWLQEESRAAKNSNEMN